jgi:predicted RNase H-like nuclease (RuvC/YqgF family)
MTQTSTTTNTNINITPIRVTAEHYQTQSFTTLDKIHEQHFNYDSKRWECSCANFRIQKNINCKHIILLRAYIKQASQAPEPEQHHSSSVELVQVLTRIAKLENSVSSIETEQHLVERDLEEHNYQLDMLLGRLTNRELQIDKQQKQLNLQSELIGNLQSDVCRQDETIKKLLAALDQQGNMLQALALQAGMYQRLSEDQAQQIDRLHDQIGQQKAEQVVRVVVEGAAPKQARQERQPAEDAVKQVSKTECKLGKFNVKVVGNCAAGCDCSIGIMDRQCPHMIKVDQFLSK